MWYATKRANNIEKRANFDEKGKNMDVFQVFLRATGVTIACNIGLGYALMRPFTCVIGITLIYQWLSSVALVAQKTSS